ncbi:MAG: ATP-binding protein [Promethearchaeota archaeon]
MIKLVKLSAEGFKNLKIKDLEFPPEGNILISGKNESGKSTLFEAIFFALTSNLLVKKNKGYIDGLSFEKNKAVVDLIFEKNDILARIRKSIVRNERKPSSTSLYLEFWENYRDEQQPPDYEGSSREVDPVIEKFLGFDKDVLLSSSFVKQKGLEEFIEATRQNRIKVLNKLLNLEKFSILIKEYKNKKKVLENNLIDYENKIRICENRNKINEDKSKIAEIETRIQMVEELLDKWREQKEYHEKSRLVIEKFRENLGKTKELNEYIKRYNMTLEELENKYKVLLDEKEVCIRIENLKSEIRNKENIEKSIEKQINLYNEKLKVYEDKLRRYNDQKSSLKKYQDKLQGLGRGFEYINQFKPLFGEIDNYKANIKDIQFSLSGIKSRLQLDYNDFEKLKNELINELQDDLIKLENNIIQFKQYKEDISQKNEKLSEYKDEKAIAENKKSIEIWIKSEESLIERALSKLSNIRDSESNKTFYEKRIEENIKKINDYKKILEPIVENKKEIESAKGLGYFIKTKDFQLKYLPILVALAFGLILFSLVEPLLILIPILGFAAIIFKFYKDGLLIKPKLTSEELNRYSTLSKEINSLELENKECNHKLVEIKNNKLENKNELVKILNKLATLVATQENLEFLEKSSNFNNNNNREIYLSNFNKLQQFLSNQSDDLWNNLNQIQQLLIDRRRLLLELNTQLKNSSSDEIDDANGVFSGNIDALNDEIEALTREIGKFEHHKEVLGNNIKDLSLKLYRTQMDPQIFQSITASNSSEKIESDEFLDKLLENIKISKEYLDKNLNWDNFDQSISLLSQFHFLSNKIEDLKELQAKILKLQQQSGTLQNKIGEINLNIQTLYMKIPLVYRSDREKFEQDYERIKSQIIHYETNIKNLENELSKINYNELINSIEGTNKSIEAEHEKIKKIKSEIMDLYGEIEKIKKNLSSFIVSENIAIDNLIWDRENFEHQEKELKTQIEDTKENITKKEKKIEVTWENLFNEIYSLFNDFQKQEYSKEFINELKSGKIIFDKANFENNPNDNEKEYDRKFGIVDKDDNKDLVTKIEQYLVNKKREYEKKLEDLKDEFKKLISNVQIDDLEDMESVLENYIRSQNGIIGSLKREIDSCNENISILEENINEDVDLDYESLKKIYIKKCEELKILKKAIELIEEGQKRVIEKVLPKTEAYLIKILPILTANRYKDAMITPDYQIKIFESKMGGYVEKTLFSGGTNDQIALAIRLAFAMAILGDSQSNESFIFLDEPLGFFDDERKTSLIDLLTNGIIANKFAQRIVISNFLNIKKYFDFYIELDNGTIVEQKATGSLDSFQYDSILEEQDSEEIIKIESISSPESDEDGEFFNNYLGLRNISQLTINHISLSIDQPSVTINPSSFFNIKPGEMRKITVGFHRDIIEESLFFKININIKDPEKRTSQKIEFIPDLVTEDMDE